MSNHLMALTVFVLVIVCQPLNAGEGGLSLDAPPTPSLIQKGKNETKTEDQSSSEEKQKKACLVFSDLFGVAASARGGFTTERVLMGTETRIRLNHPLEPDRTRAFEKTKEMHQNRFGTEASPTYLSAIKPIIAIVYDTPWFQGLPFYLLEYWYFLICENDKDVASTSLGLAYDAKQGEIPFPPEVMHGLTVAGADPNAKATNGETILMFAVTHGRLDAVNALLAAGADPNTKDNSGLVAVGYAIVTGQDEIVRALYKAGSKPFDETQE